MQNTRTRLRGKDDRGQTRIGWLESYHTFSFGDYYDPAHMGFSDLRVINDDYVKAGGGFPTHPHRDMEIVTYILSGELEHKDSMGNGSVIRPGDVQRMSAGTGVLHSEFNPSDQNPVHLLQIWILPEAKGMSPGYEQKAFTEDQKRNRWCLIASRDGRDGSVTVHQDISVYSTLLGAGRELAWDLADRRKAWLHVASGAVEIDGQFLEAGDALALEEAGNISIRGVDIQSEILLFDLRA